MSLATLIIDGVLLLAMVGVSLYGASALPPGAQVPIHFGPASYNNWVSKSVGLTLWPASGAVLYAILVVAARNQRVNGGSGPPAGLTVALALMLVTQVGALRVALNRSGRG
jgi:hypothetical protein